MTRISVYQLMKLNPNSNITLLRIWDEDKQVYLGMMDRCPKKYLHKPIAEWRVSEFELVVYY